MRFTRRIMAARALARFEPDEFRPGPGYDTDDELTRGAGELGTTIFIPSARARWETMRWRLSTIACE